MSEGENSPLPKRRQEKLPPKKLTRGELFKAAWVLGGGILLTACNSPSVEEVRRTVATEAAKKVDANLEKLSSLIKELRNLGIHLTPLTNSCILKSR